MLTQKLRYFTNSLIFVFQFLLIYIWSNWNIYSFISIRIWFQWIQTKWYLVTFNYS